MRPPLRNIAFTVTALLALSTIAIVGGAEVVMDRGMALVADGADSLARARSIAAGIVGAFSVTFGVVAFVSTLVAAVEQLNNGGAR